MDEFAALTAFTRAVDLGSFSKAAAERGIKVSTVSRYVSALEADVGAALLNRSTRRLHLTEVGTFLHQRATRILADLDEAKETARSMNRHPQGLLRLNMPGAFGRLHVMPHLPAFLAAHPDVRIEATLTNATVDLIETGTDLAVRIGTLTDSSLRAKALAPHRLALVASPAWLAARPGLSEPQDLESLDCLAAGPRPATSWYHHRPDQPAAVQVRVGGRVSANDLEALRDAALGGLGVALLPTWLVAGDLRDGQLAAVLPGWTWSLAPGPEPAIWGVYPPKKVVAPKVRAFLDFLARRFGAPPYWDDAARGALPGRARLAKT